MCRCVCGKDESGLCSPSKAEDREWKESIEGNYTETTSYPGNSSLSLGSGSQILVSGAGEAAAACHGDA